MGSPGQSWSSQGPQRLIQRGSGSGSGGRSGCWEKKGGGGNGGYSKEESGTGETSENIDSRIGGGGRGRDLGKEKGGREDEGS